MTRKWFIVAGIIGVLVGMRYISLPRTYDNVEVTTKVTDVSPSIEVTLLPGRIQVSHDGEIDTLFLNDNVESIWTGYGVKRLSTGKFKGYYITASVSGRNLTLIFGENRTARDKAYNYALGQL